MAGYESQPGNSSTISLQMGEAIVVRLSQLERELKSARRTTALLSFGLIAATALAIFALVSAVLFRGRIDAIETQQIVLRDAQGVNRATLRVTEDGTSSLSINDRNGTARLRLSVLQSGDPGIALSDNRGRARAVLGFLPEQGSTLVFADEQGSTRAVLGLTGTQGASLAFLDALGNTRASFGIDETGEANWAISEAGTEPADTTDTATSR